MGRITYMDPRNVDTVVLHHSLTKDGKTVSWSAIRRYHVHKLGWLGIGYHFGVELVGNSYEILLGRLMNQRGAHAPPVNSHSWGICVIGNFDEEPPEATQLIVVKNLVRALLDVRGLDRSAVKGHRDVQANRTCPGKLFPLEEFVRSL